MIFKITFEDGKIDWCTAKDQLHLLKTYDKNYDLVLQDIESVEAIEEALAKTIIVDNVPEQLSIWDLAINDEFNIIASSDLD